MKLKFYGTRGSIPICDAGFQQFGGNTTCLQITFTDTNRIAIIDAGTGLRNLGRDLRAIGHKQEQIAIAFTHFHWDHIQGFPFFAPAYDPRPENHAPDARPGPDSRPICGRFSKSKCRRNISRCNWITWGPISSSCKSPMPANTSPASTMCQPWSPLKGTTIPAERIVSGSSETARCSSFARMSSMASRSIRGWWSWRAARTCWSMTRNTRPRNCRNGAVGGHSSFDQAMQVAEMAGVKQPGPHASRSRTRRRVSSAHRKVMSRTVPQCGARPRRNGNPDLGGDLGCSRHRAEADSELPALGYSVGRTSSGRNRHPSHRPHVCATIGPWSYRRC